MKVKVTGTVLAYNFTDANKILVEGICRGLGIRFKIIDKEDFDKPIGAMMGFVIPNGKPENSEELKEFSDELMVMNNLRGTFLDQFLKALMTQGAKVTLKAVLTATNQNWYPKDLAAQLMKEYDQIKKMQDKNKE